MNFYDFYEFFFLWIFMIFMTDRIFMKKKQNVIEFLWTMFSARDQNYSAAKSQRRQKQFTSEWVPFLASLCESEGEEPSR